MAMEDYLDMDYDHGEAIFGWIDCEKFVHELKQKSHQDLCSIGNDLRISCKEWNP